MIRTSVSFMRRHFARLMLGAIVAIAGLGSLAVLAGASPWSLTATVTAIVALSALIHLEMRMRELRQTSSRLGDAATRLSNELKALTRSEGLAVKEALLMRMDESDRHIGDTIGKSITDLVAQLERLRLTQSEARGRAVKRIIAALESAQDELGESLLGDFEQRQKHVSAIFDEKATNFLMEIKSGDDQKLREVARATAERVSRLNLDRLAEELRVSDGVRRADAALRDIELAAFRSEAMSRLESIDHLDAEVRRWLESAHIVDSGSAALRDEKNE